MPEYSVRINGFRVIQDCPDDILSRDGVFNEVQISVITTILDGAGKLVGVPSEKTTPIMGDVNRFTNRVKAGSASSLGGLRTGDAFPDEPMPWLPLTPISPLRDYPPYEIYRGNLPEDGSRNVILNISVLEYDFGTDFWIECANLFKQIDDEFGKKAQAAFGKLFPVAIPVFDAVSVGIQTVAALPRFLGAPGTRPIGMMTDPSDPSKYVYPPKMLGLNAKTAAEIVTTNYLPGKAGVFSTPYKDAGSLGGGTFELFFEVVDLDALPAQWTPMGAALRVRGLSTWGSWLLAISDDNRLWYRPWNDADIPWTLLGSAPLPAGMAINLPLIFCAGRDNNLYVKVDPFVTPWQRIGHANDVTAMAFAAGKLFCSTRDNALWTREPVMQEVDWQRIGHANSVVAMAGMGADLVCATADRQLWTRPATTTDTNWTIIGTAPANVTGLAYQATDASIWVTTADNRLWKFRP